MSDAREPGYGGHMTLADGSHVHLSPEEAKRLWDDSTRRTAERAVRLPDEGSALRAMFDAYDRLRELGWRDACYCPKDGSSFDVIEAGSSGIHRAHYDGVWPTGTWWIEDGGDLWPSRPILFRLSPTEPT